eukprot:scaffold699_cov385-Prasinococcus_capsulatus_cf.AAC.34
MRNSPVLAYLEQGVRSYASAHAHVPQRPRRDEAMRKRSSCASRGCRTQHNSLCNGCQQVLDMSPVPGSESECRAGCGPSPWRHHNHDPRGRGPGCPLALALP